MRRFFLEPVSRGNRKSCPSCGAQLRSSIMSIRYYVRGKARHYTDVCDDCWQTTFVTLFGYISDESWSYGNQTKIFQRNGVEDFLVGWPEEWVPWQVDHSNMDSSLKDFLRNCRTLEDFEVFADLVDEFTDRQKNLTARLRSSPNETKASEHARRSLCCKLYNLHWFGEFIFTKKSADLCWVSWLSKDQWLQGGHEWTLSEKLDVLSWITEMWKRPLSNTDRIFVEDLCKNSDWEMVNE